MILQPPISTLFPYTTLFRSREGPRLATSQFSRILDLDLITDDGNCLYGLVQTREKTNRAAHTARRAPCAYRRAVGQVRVLPRDRLSQGPRSHPPRLPEEIGRASCRERAYV